MNSDHVKDILIKILILIGMIVIVAFPLLYAIREDETVEDPVNVCDSLLSSELVNEIASYEGKVNTIITKVLEGNYKNLTYLELSQFIDKFGNRFLGTENLENSIDYMLSLLEGYGFDNVHSENVSAVNWVRGSESALLISPRRKQLNILGLGYSVGFFVGELNASAIVVQSFEELYVRASEAVDKIVVFAEPWLGSYGKTVEYRSRAAVEAGRLGAVAVLIRSITPFSINSPHTGMMSYDDNVKKIPAAAITVEDAMMLLRMAQRGSELRIILNMEARQMDIPAVSRNTVAELTGSEFPEKVVLVSGHLDSWDVGSGAMDDGGGAFISWAALALLKSLDLRPKRTIRVVLWTGEEMGLLGAQAYAEAHANETGNFVAMMESDEGTFTPYGLQYMGPDEGGCIVQEILKLMEPLKATTFENSTDVGSDIMTWANKVPLLANLNRNERYFWFHHSAGDTMSVMDPDDLDKNLALWAATAYVLADISTELPKPGSSPPAS